MAPWLSRAEREARGQAERETTSLRSTGGVWWCLAGDLIVVGAQAQPVILWDLLGFLVAAAAAERSDSGREGREQRCLDARMETEATAAE